MKMTATRANSIDKMTMAEFAALSRTARQDYLRLPLSPQRVQSIRRKLSERELAS